MNDESGSSQAAHQPSCPDKRRYARFEMLEYVMVYREHEVEPETAVLVDISLGGAQTRSRHSMEVGEVCLLAIATGNSSTVTVTAEVRYCYPVKHSDLYAIGYRFLPETVEERLQLVDYVHDVFQRQGELLIT
jgi:c-di-GMP-binding flagellar brake protein YcgR